MPKDKKRDKYLVSGKKYFTGFKFKPGNLAKQVQVPEFTDNTILLLTLEEAKEAQKDLQKFNYVTEICEL